MQLPKTSDNLLFHIRRIEASGHVPSDEVGERRLPQIGFIYITGGEVLIEIEGISYLCLPGQLLLIPQQMPFSIRYYRDTAGFKGGFMASFLSDSQPLRFLSGPLHQGFWFDEGTFMGELFNMLAVSFDKGDRVFIEKGLDLLLARLRPDRSAVIPAAVNGFLESVFDPDRTPGTIASYAAEAGISENYLGRQVKKSTGRSVGDWIDIVRIQRAKKLLSSTRMPVIDIAAAAGIDDQSYFSRLFKKETGLTPSAFRKNMQVLVGYL